MHQTFKFIRIKFKKDFHWNSNWNLIVKSQSEVIKMIRRNLSLKYMRWAKKWSFPCNFCEILKGSWQDINLILFIQQAFSVAEVEKRLWTIDTTLNGLKWFAIQSATGVNRLDSNSFKFLNSRSYELYLFDLVL